MKHFTDVPTTKRIAMHTGVYINGHMDRNGVSSTLFEYLQLWGEQNALKGDKEAVLCLQLLSNPWEPHFLESHAHLARITIRIQKRIISSPFSECSLIFLLSSSVFPNYLILGSLNSTTPAIYTIRTLR